MKMPMRMFVRPRTFASSGTRSDCPIPSELASADRQQIWRVHLGTGTVRDSVEWMMARVRFSTTILFAMGLAMVAGCSSHAVSEPVRALSQRTSVSETTLRHSPFRLYTHCGIEWALIAGVYWHATRPLSDGQGNPPAGWGNPFQDGTLILLDQSTARFTSAAGSVTLRRTDRTEPPFVCS
jgi:hypothetical protein